MSTVRAIDRGDSSFRYALYRDSMHAGQVDFLLEPSVPNPAWLGSLPAVEMFLGGLELPWDDDWLSTGTELLRAAIADLPPTVPSVLQANTNLEVHEHPLRRIHLFEALGFELFQEKHGYLWVDRGEPLASTLETHALEEVGDEAYASVLARIPADGLDRNDNHYYAATGADNWARVMMTFLKPEDRSSCLLGYEEGEAVGLVGLSAFDEEATGTISYIGVVPEHRGRGLGRRLLTAATLAARQRGFPRVLSDVDVRNVPMRVAMVACGHQPDLRPWHRWAYWLRLR